MDFPTKWLILYLSVPCLPIINSIHVCASKTHNIQIFLLYSILTSGKQYNIRNQLFTMICNNFNAILCFDQLEKWNLLPLAKPPTKANEKEVLQMWVANPQIQRKYLCQIGPWMQINSPAFKISCNYSSHFIIKTSATEFYSVGSKVC